MILFAAAPAAATTDRTWYVSAAASPGGNGTAQKPFNSLAAVEQASHAGDTIVVVPVPTTVPPLDGGIAVKRAETTGYNIFAEHDWWGSSTGPRPGQVASINGSIQTSPFRTSPPASCGF